MDISKQYPTLSHDNENEAVFDIESLSIRLGLSTVDLVQLLRTFDKNTVDNLAVRSGKSPEEILRLLNTAKQYFIIDLKPVASELSQKYIPTNLGPIDKSLSGGIPIGQITEVFGASGCGKSQFLLTLMINALASGINEETSSIYISTESTLESRRLNDFSKNVPSALDRISYIYCPDLEHQDHILFTQLSLKLREEIKMGRRPRMVVIDSIGHHLRAEDTFLNSSQFFRSHLTWQEEQLSSIPMYQQEKARFDSITNKFSKGNVKFRNRTSKKYYLFTLYAHLAELAVTYNVAVVLANQVSDVMDRKFDGSFGDWGSGPDDEDPLDFNVQVGTFSGWDATTYTSSDSFEKPSPKVSGTGAEPLRKDPESRKRKNYEDTAVEKNSSNTDIWREEMLPYNGPKKKVPAMGYTWSKLMAYRILLWKRYQPVFDHTDNANIENLTGNKIFPNGNSTSGDNIRESDKEMAISSQITPKIAGFKIQRFARVVSSQAMGTATAQFEISQTGLSEVHADANTGHNT